MAAKKKGNKSSERLEAELEKGVGKRHAVTVMGGGPDQTKGGKTGGK